MKLISWFKILCGMLLVLCYHHAYALYISADISSMESGDPFFSKPYINDTKKTNLYTFSVYQIDRPGYQEQGTPIQNGEILFTPLKKILLPGEQEFFKIFYRGEADEKERYYKIIISETPLDIRNDEGQKKQPLFYPTVSLETYFVVRPKDPDFKYDLNINQGILKNTGNTYFRVLLHQNCDGDDDSEPYVFYLLPNQQIKDLRLSQKSRKYIVIFDKYYSIGNCE
ncbi:fimbrial protein [Proteus mirabilis]|uniref:fimbrial protein n=1 Tax=Proteus mirabilis TaxID=584 RepID=UPI000D143334|nr:fimbrial protein [Proteus mirabilis]AZH00296.1 fimbrial protein [Proteus mirabilis]MBG2990723.1 fimbrial protein [Proteus mirabilis]MBG6040918.1 fimbrial protein [Proteus mirabilis]MBS3855730.1 fimbrial protein [Proteus mirabilis]MCI9768050.1 fimbrial protein [Proteus mirabilis]